MNTKTKTAVDNARALAALADVADAAEDRVTELKAELAKAEEARDIAVKAVEAYVEKMA